ncbi:MAG: diguanylate cyclase [Sulfurimonas sp.]|uniref:sensor domain-containing diguanylate cyclase n=1 Tax=Sulfurimonas sp. TaxID=2022749 RepID=UPI0025EC2429|nr:diguanylate cyclase [Sulfurimonas sp.]MCK9453786.1 diguanylate cyclase [Sulfurimonas sp.]
MTQQNFKKYFILYFIGFGITISIFGAFISYIFQMQNIQKHMDLKAKEIFYIKIETVLKPTIKNMDDIVKSFTSNSTIREFLITNSLEKQAEVENILLAVTGVENKIMQSRILDKSGKEIIRVDRLSKNNQPFIVEKERLQDKSQRTYFQELSKMSSETIWHSKLDLNIENNRVEIPYRPTIRIAMPILQNGEFLGVVIINLLTKELFDAIGISTSFEHFIIDKDNNFIMHPDKKYSFNKYKGIDRKLEEDFADGLSANGIYTYSIDNILQNEDEALFILKSNDTYQENLIDESINTGITVFFLTVLLSFTMAFFASKVPTRLQLSLLEAHRKLKEFTSIMDCFIITATTKPDGTILKISNAFIRSSGYTREELIGKKMNIIKNPDRDKLIIKNLWDTILSKKTWIGEIENRKKDGTTYWLEQHIIPTINENGTIDSFVSIGIDITAKKELEKLATTDKLTGIYNRRRVDEFLQTEIEIAKRHSQELSIILIDIDHFKSVNDTYGHQRGDMVLRKTTEIISKNLRKSDIFGRWGGEEFLIICPQTNRDEAFILAQKLRDAIQGYKFEVVGEKTISLGISQLQEGDTEKTLIQRADNALYSAKNSGRNRAVIFE